MGESVRPQKQETDKRAVSGGNQEAISTFIEMVDNGNVQIQAHYDRWTRLWHFEGVRFRPRKEGE